MSATTQTWTSASTYGGAGTYDWLSGSNWISAIPGGTDEALFPLTPGTNPYEVLIELGSSGNAQNFVSDDPNLNFHIGVGTGAFQVFETMAINAGTLTLNDGSFTIGGENNSGPDGTLYVGSGGTVAGDGVVADSSGIQTFNNSGADVGTLMFNGGTVFAVAGSQNALEVFATVVGTANFHIEGNAGLILDYPVLAPASTVAFDGGASATGVLIDSSENTPFGIDSNTSFTLNISGFDVGSGTTALDSIEIASDLTATATLTGSVLTITKADSTVDTFTLTGATYSGDTVNSSNDGTNTFFFLDTVCFAAGTQIRTEAGECLVEDLKEGDLVAIAQDGEVTFQPVKWVGNRTIDLTRHPRPRFAAPIRIVRGAIAENLPVRDLVVSPDHCLLLDGKLIPAKLLINGMTIRQELETRSVTYYHVEMPKHSILLAEGVAAESYLDTGNRSFFSNAGLALMLHPEFHVNAGLRHWEADACAPLTVRPDAVLPVWRPIADRAVALGHTPPEFATTTDADLHLLADGRRIDTIATAGDTHSFLVPAGVQSLVLASRSVVPHELTPYLDDPRQIGVSVRHIVMRGRTDRVEFSPDHPSLTCGWHAPEKAEGALWRWTLGQGALPVGVVDGPMILEITVASTTIYRIDEHRLEGRLAA